MYIPIDIDRLRSDLIQYLGTAAYLNPNAQADLIIAENTNDYKIIEMARNYGFEMTDYAVTNNYDDEEKEFTR